MEQLQVSNFIFMVFTYIKHIYIYIYYKAKEVLCCFYCVWCIMSWLVAKPTKWHVRPAKTQISLGIRPVWSESSLSAWRKLGFLATNWVHSKDSQTGRMPRLIRVLAGRTVILLVLSWGGSCGADRNMTMKCSDEWKAVRAYCNLNSGH